MNKRDRFTYSRTKDGEKKFLGFDFYLDGDKPIFKKPIKCGDDDALLLIQSLNRLKRKEINKLSGEIIRDWLLQVGHTERQRREHADETDETKSL